MVEPAPVIEPAPSVEPAPAVEPAPTVPAPGVVEDAARDFMPTWLIYALLGLGNLVILGGGYWLFRRSMAETSEPVMDFSDLTPVAPSAASDMAMDGAESDDDMEPPMEDLANEGSDDAIPSLKDVVDEEFPEDLQQELVEQVMGNESDEAKEDFVAEIRRAQGLDMAESELDDAISSLIDELDGEPRREADDLDDLDRDKT